MISDECTMRKQRHIKCSHRLAKIAQTVENKHAPGIDAIVAMTTYILRKSLLLGIAALHDFCMK